MKKILLIIAIVFLIFQIAVAYTVIDIGSPAIDRDTISVDATYVDKNNPANASGKITSVEIWAEITLINAKVATFYVVSGNNLSTRDYQVIGNVTSGAKRTFDVDLDVQIGDYIGISYTDGYLDRVNTGTGYWATPASTYWIPCTNHEFNFIASRTISLYGTGTTEVGWPHKWNTKTIIKWNTKEIIKWNGVE